MSSRFATLLAATLSISPAIGQDRPIHQRSDETSLQLFLPACGGGDRIRRWVADVVKHWKTDLDLILVSGDRYWNREDRLIEVAKAVQAASPGISFRFPHEEDLKLLKRCNVSRLPAWLYFDGRKVHVWQGVGSWHEFLSCRSK